MILKSLSLQNFRSYNKAEFTFDRHTTFVVGPNTAGKTNLIEAIYLLATGKSFRADKDIEMIGFGEDIGRVVGEAINTSDGGPEHSRRNSSEVDVIKLEVVFTTEPSKKYLVNGIARRRVDFAGNLVAVIFSPSDLEIIVDSPSLRRNFLDDVLIQVDRDYRISLTSFTKALRQRNALLERAREEGRRDEKHFLYWDELLIEHGQMLTKKREGLIYFFNEKEKEIFDFSMFYDKSIISKERLLQYKEAEVGAGVTLVGPHRDDFSIHMFNNTRNMTHDVKLFGSRGQQRLAILQLKLLELSFIEKAMGERPVLLLDDIFSELDSDHIHHVLELIGQQQTILTTTHSEFIPKKMLTNVVTIELFLDK